ncbi:unnamed protein product [Spirodela intermedia]|uniref:Uncharacterized protein n=1 Tax=Spirodela intermedia TaxID=51605 RepID=A0A7I8KPF4_SPIIN|nr:unnamed protein product [Spirodela intermedia]
MEFLPRARASVGTSGAAWSISIIFLLCQVLQAKTLRPNMTLPRVPAVIVFGDSIVDPGNNNLLGTLTKSNFPPYGKDFPGHQATGRFSNGKIPTDLIVSDLGIKELLPAYLDPNLHPEELLTGVSFASGGSGFDPITPTVTNVLSQEDQLELFKEYKGKVRGMVGAKRAASIVQESLYVICQGSNDLANTYFNGPFRRPHYDLPSYVKLMVDSASGFVKNLYGQGARKIGFMGIPPLGCVPADRTFFGGPQRDCSEELNQASQLFNDALAVELHRLSHELPGSNLIYVDIYTLMIDVIQRPTHYGFEEATKGCCGTGNLEASVTCNSLMASTCEDPTKYVFWDGYHPTETAYRLLIDEIARKYLHALTG